MIVTRKKKGEIKMAKETREDIRTISDKLTSENKKYVLAVANALMFSQQNHNDNSKNKNQPQRKTG